MNDDKRKKLEANTKNLLELLGEDPSREGLINTPKRVAKAWDFLTKGYTENLDELINNAIFEGEYQYPQPELLGDPLPNPITYSAPCKESRYRTAIKPLEWDQ